jgi:hypothetical protein
VVKTVDGELCSASFFAPWSRDEEPYIRIATGDYRELKEEEGRDNALAAFIVSMSHEVVHYQRWVETGEIWERGVARKALGMLRRYSSTVAHPWNSYRAEAADVSERGRRALREAKAHAALTSHLSNRRQRT